MPFSLFAKFLFGVIGLDYNQLNNGIQMIKIRFFMGL
jgi:hypothetical protein